MNREIKFRIWNEKQNRFLYCDKYRFNCFGITFRKTDSLYAGAFIDSGRLIIQQYTGLKTKTGQEIYEGDIINTKAARYEVIFRDGMFVAKRLMGLGNEFYPLIEIAEIAFVIGNIFENPELLKDVIKDNFNKNE